MSKVTFDLPAGIRVRDKITGLIGIITTRVERINGCVQYQLDPPRKEDGGRVVGKYIDFEEIEVIDALGKKIKKESVTFKFNTGDKLRNRVNGKQGIATVRRIDPNGCLGYWIENGEQNPKNGEILDFYGFEQEYEKIDDGLNKKTEKKIERARTGCTFVESPPK